MKTSARVLLSSLSLFVLLGADGCPFTVNPEQGGSTSTGGGAAVDVGGSSGALWQVLFEEPVLITVRAGSQVAAKQTEGVDSGLVTLLGGSVDVGSFCLRSDVVCPHQVLPGRTAVLQPADLLGTVAVSFNRRGPLAALPVSATGIAGQLDGKELMIPLAVADAAQGSCALGATSLLAATASAASGSGTRADTLKGRVTLSYDGACVNLGGSGAFDPETRVELAMSFVAKRE